MPRFVLSKKEKEWKNEKKEAYIRSGHQWISAIYFLCAICAAVRWQKALHKVSWERKVINKKPVYQIVILLKLIFWLVDICQSDKNTVNDI